MNLLLAEIRRSLKELTLGLKVLSSFQSSNEKKPEQNSFALIKSISLSIGRTDHLLQYGESAVSPVYRQCA